MTADAHRQGQRLVSFPPSPRSGTDLDESIEAPFKTTYQEDPA
jgi:hypothetical protein